MRNEDGLTYAFTCLNLEKRGVQEVTDVLGTYKHLREVNLNHNDIREIAEVQRLDYITKLQASHNKVESIAFFAEINDSLQYLQVSAS